MAKEPAMKCEDNGHDSRTCNCCTGIRLFGVQINVADDNGKKNWESLMRKSKSLGNLEACNVENTLVEAAYHSDGFMHQSSISKEGHERKRGKPWSEEEHRSFLVGLEKLGKGDWKGISKNYVPSRTSSQVASHAQKYFIRLSATEKKRRRSSVFDISLIEKNASASLGSPSNKAFEISPHTSSSDAALKNLGEFERQASMQPPATSSEKRPLSPMPKLHGITNFGRVPPYMHVNSLGSPSNKAFEISPHTSSSDAALKNLGEFERQAIMQPPATTSEKRPLSPMPKLHGITNFGRVAPYMHVNCTHEFQQSTIGHKFFRGVFGDIIIEKEVKIFEHYAF